MLDVRIRPKPNTRGLGVKLSGQEYWTNVLKNISFAYLFSPRVPRTFWKTEFQFFGLKDLVPDFFNSFHDLIEEITSQLEKAEDNLRVRQATNEKKNTIQSIDQLTPVNLEIIVLVVN